MPDTTLTVRPDAPIGTISPRVYGHFAEHIGRCCYDGLWVGLGEKSMPHKAGFRCDVLDALQALPVPLLRWPGGCYADHYHWQDGIGPPAERPHRLGMSCGLQVQDDNSLGTHEFLQFCAMLGAEPYLAGNVGSGSPQELCDWVEYCNSAVETTLARARAANGATAPFGVRLWGVGNENWGCGGNFDAADYAREHRRYATMLRHVDAKAELVACGYDDAWNVEFLQTLSRHVDLLDHLSIHDYWTTGGPETAFDEEDYYALLTAATGTERFIERTAAIIRDATGGNRPIGIALDEWGVWHPEARTWGSGDVPRRNPVTYEQANTMRDAVAAAIALEGFHRQCQVLTLANLAQVVNVLQAPVMTEGPRMWLTPTYHVFQLHALHHGATAVPVEVTAGNSLPDGTSGVTATASKRDGALAVTLINRHISRPTDVRISGVGQAEKVSGQLLTASSPNAANSASSPDCVAPRPCVAGNDGRDGWRAELPAHSVLTLVIEVAS